MGLCFCGLSVKFREVQRRRPWTTLASLSCLISTLSHTLLPFSQNQRETFITFSQHLILYFNEELFSSSPLRLRLNSEFSLSRWGSWSTVLFWRGVLRRCGHEMNEITVLRNYVLRRERGITHAENVITAGLHQCCSPSVQCEIAHMKKMEYGFS